MTEVFGGQSYQLLYGLGQGLIHSVWQCAALAVVLAGALALLRGRSPNLRYAAACSALALMLLVPAATVWTFLSVAQAAGAEDVAEPLGAAGDSAVEPAELPRPARDYVTERVSRPVGAAPRAAEDGAAHLLPWVTLLWLMGVSVLSARTLGGLMFARRLKRSGVQPVERRWREKAAEIARRLSVSGPVRVLESSLVAVPTAVGWLRPAILLPASAFTGLTPQQLEAILAHELAHVRRHDYLVNVLQTVVESLLFYHPAVWWVSRQIRDEREHACDDMVVSVTGDALTYARALTKVERLRDSAPSLALAADGGSLRARVLRLVEGPPRARRATSYAAALFSIAAVLTTVACARAVLSQRQRGGTPTRQSKIENSGASAPSSPAGEGAQSSAGGAAASLIAADVTEGEDAEVRRVATAALGGREGAVVVMNPRTGRVYAVVNQEWALRRGWAPASTMKLVTSIAGVGEKLFDPAERVRIQGRAERLELTRALALSDNDYFKMLGARVGPGPILDYARRLGLGERTGINYEGEVAGRLPSAESADAARLGFGEGIEVTPLQLAVLVSAVANGGTLVVPRVPRTAQEAAGFTAEPGRPAGIPRATLEQVVPGMVAAVERGTASGIGDKSLKIAGKTGTLSSKGSGRESDLGIFASYAPADDPRLTVVVLASGEGVNGRAAAKIAGAIYRGLRGRLSE